MVPTTQTSLPGRRERIANIVTELDAISRYVLWHSLMFRRSVHLPITNGRNLVRFANLSTSRKAWMGKVLRAFCACFGPLRLNHTPPLFLFVSKDDYQQLWSIDKGGNSEDLDVERRHKRHQEIIASVFIEEAKKAKKLVGKLEAELVDWFERYETSTLKTRHPRHLKRLRGLLHYLQRDLDFLLVDLVAQWMESGLHANFAIYHSPLQRHQASNHYRRTEKEWDKGEVVVEESENVLER